MEKHARQACLDPRGESHLASRPVHRADRVDDREPVALRDQPIQFLPVNDLLEPARNTEGMQAPCFRPGSEFLASTSAELRRSRRQSTSGAPNGRVPVEIATDRAAKFNAVPYYELLRERLRPRR